MLTRLINLARQLAKALGLPSASPTSSRVPTADSQLTFLIEILQATADSKGNAEVVYPLLQANLDKLDDNLALLLRDWATAKLAEVEPEQAQGIAEVIFYFSNRIQEFPLGSRATNLEIAITGYEVVGTVFTREAFPQEWAMTQNNLAIAYSDRIRGDKADNLEDAIAFYQAALQVRTREAFPQDWAITQNNLATAYLYRIRGDKADNLENAIAFYQAALQVRTREAFPQDWAKTQNNLAIAYRNRIRGDKADNLEAAIKAYQAALQVYTREAFPQDWAMTKNNLATAYLERIRGDKADNLENAIAFYQAALQVRTREAFPQNWATTQNNLANAYLERIRGDKADNLEKAIAFYQAALQVRTREAFPQNHAETLFNLGLAYQDAQQFTNAYHSFAEAIETVESLRMEIVLGSAVEEDKQKLAEEWNKLYSRMVAVCLELNYHDQAIEYIERSKTRNLIELFATAKLKPKAVTENITKQFHQLRQQWLDAQRNLEDSQHITQRRQQLDDFIAREITPHDPNFRLLEKVQAISLEEIRTSLDNQTVIIEWYITPEYFYALTITSDSQQPDVWQSSPEDLKQLQEWAYEYLKDYYLQQSHWRKQLNSRLSLLAEILHLDQIIS
ncbi:MAG: sel1 repeat family protein, partial [Symploca sp. SIO2E9]|nr:sel1 repeat family protein [Symploca sp. SIO2E9]